MSFTAASLRIHDTLLVAEALVREELYELDEQLGYGKTATGNRIRRELVKRIKTLTKDQLQYMLDAGLDEARKIAFLAICKTYDYIHEFVVEVLREKITHLDYQITEGEYLAFFHRKSEAHPELQELSGNSLEKIRQTIFKILEEVKIIDSTQNKILQPQFMSQPLQKIIRNEDPMLLRIFFMTDAEINL